MSVTSGVSTSNCRGSSDEASPPDTRRAWALCRGIVPSFFPESRPCVCHAQQDSFRRLSSCANDAFEVPLISRKNPSFSEGVGAPFGPCARR